MNEFVNYKHRGVELPEGCKDLIDVLSTTPSSSKTPSSSGGSDFSLKKEHVAVGGLARIEDYLRRFFASRSKPLLSFFPTRGQLAFTLMYAKTVPNLIFCFSVQDTAREKAVRGVFAEVGIPCVSDALVPKTKQRVLGYPLPTLQSDAVKLVTELLRKAYAVTDEAGLEFLYGE